MAENKKGLKAFEEHLTCPICLEVFDSPRTLSCSHLLCTKCLEQLFTASGAAAAVICPSCSKPTQVPNGDINTIPEIFYIKNLITVMESHNNQAEENGKILCDNCEEGKEGVVHCFQCEDYLCDLCLQAHQKMKVTRNHKVLGKDEVKPRDFKNPLLSKDAPCKKHHEKLIAFCETCQLPVCHMCVTISHKEHAFIEIEEATARQEKNQHEAYMKKKDDFTHLRNQISNNLIVAENSLELLLKRKELSVQVFHEKKAEINQRFDSLTECIEKRREKVNHDLVKLENERLKMLTSQEDDLKSDLVNVKRTMAFLDHSLKEENRNELLSLKTEMTNQIIEVASKTYSVEPIALATIDFLQSTEILDEILKNIAQFGNIAVSDPTQSASKHVGACGFGQSPSGGNGKNPNIKKKQYSLRISHPPHCVALKGIQEIPQNHNDAIQYINNNIMTSCKPIVLLPLWKLELTVKCFDSDKNEIKRGGDEVKAVLINDEDTVLEEFSTVDVGDGTYKIKTSHKGSGTYEVSVKVNGEDIQHSPFTIHSWALRHRNGTEACARLSLNKLGAIGPGVVIGDVGVTKGIHFWKVLISWATKQTRWVFCLGVSLNQSEFHKRTYYAIDVYTSNTGNYYSIQLTSACIQGKICPRDRCYKDDEPLYSFIACKPQVPFILTLDLDKKMLDLSIERDDLGKCIFPTLTSDINGRIYPHFSLGKEVSVEIMS